jgi:serine/threonine protein kinase
MNDRGSSNPGFDASAHAPGVRTAREQVEAARLRRDRLIAAGVLPTELAEPAAALPIKDFSGYTLLREIHRGGQGVVYQALQQSTHRKVAVKVLLEGAYASKSARQRFEREIELVASLRHPNVISVFHSDQTEDGLRFCVMDYVRGLPLTRYVRDNQLSLEEALKLFATVCEAVNHAHQKGVIHRDLKPSNILVDVEGVPRVLDFGLAKLVCGTGFSTGEPSIMTMTGQVVGTLPYMSPEQTRGNPEEIDTRTDVYALGVLLYEMLTGRYPYPVVGEMADVLRHIAQTEPTPPSRAWTAESGIAASQPAGFIRKFTGWKPVPHEVQTIVLKALAKERDRRYQSAGELARDIGHYLAGEPIEAKRDSTLYVFRKQLRRHKAAVASVAAVFVVLVAGIIVSTSLYFRAETARAEQARERQRAEEGKVLAEAERNRAQLAEASAAAQADRAEKEAQTARQTTDFLVGLFEVSDPSQALGNTITAREILDRGVKKIGEELKDQPLVRATLQDTMGRVYTSLGLYEPAEELLREALATRRNLLGNEHPDVATSLYNLAAVLVMFQGNYAGAEQTAREALAIRRRVFGDEHKEVADSLDQLAGVLSDTRNYAEAEQLYHQALAINLKLFGDDHEQTMNTLHNLARLYFFQRKDGDAEPMFREVHAWERKHWPDGHPDMAITLDHLGAIVDRKGQHDEAERLAREALAINRKYLGPEHPLLAAHLCSVGTFAERRGDFEEVERLARESLSIYDAAKFLSDDWVRIHAKGLLGGVAAHRGQFIEAEPMLLQAYDVLMARTGFTGSKRLAFERIVRMYELWDAAEPGKGYDAQAAEWREKLRALQAATQAATTQSAAAQASQSGGERH